MNRRAIGAVALAATVALIATACSGSPDSDGALATGGTLTLGASIDATSWDPADAEFGNRLQYMQPVYDSLLHIDENLEITPWLASDYSYNGDNTQLTLTLRDDVTFTDGETFDAEAAKANLEHFKSGTGQNSVTLSAVESIEVTGDDTLVLDLSAPDPALLRNLALVSGMQASPAALDSEDLKTTPVGSGPYVLDASRTTTGSQYVYTRNSDYWNAEAFPFDEIMIKPMTDLTARLNALKAGEIDATLADAKSIAEAKASGLTAQTMQGDWQGLFILDRDGSVVPALADERVRQAMNYAIDGAGILQAVRLGEGEVTTQIFNPSSAAYDASLDDAYPFDPEKARELLAEAGYPDGFTITMPEFAGTTDLTTVAYQQLRDVGIDVQVETVAPDQIIATMLSGQYAAFLFSWGSSNAWQDILKLVKPDAPWNPYHSTTPELEALIAAAQTSGSDADFQAVSAYLVDQAWFAPWYVQNNVYLNGPTVTVALQPQNVVPYIWNYAPAK